MQAKPYNKMRNIRTEYNGRTYDSHAEARRAEELDTLKMYGDIVEVIPQFPMPIFINDIKVCTYFADFKVTYKDGRIEYEDVKGFKTAMYKLKKKMVKAYYGIDILEINWEHIYILS